MTSPSVLALEPFADWIRKTDEHAEHHLDLLNQVNKFAVAERTGDIEERKNLAHRLERWRYQLLNEQGPGLSNDGRALLDALDLCANELAGRPRRRPRSTQDAIEDVSRESGSIGRAVDMLCSDAPLDTLASEARRMTEQEFSVTGAGGSAPPRRRMLLYAPLYVSSECINHCTYCGFRYPEDIPRKHLNLQEAVDQADVLQRRGFSSILIVGGDFPSRTTSAYYQQIARRLVQNGVEPSIEIASQSTESYEDLAAAGVCGVTLYQETYDRSRYSTYHVRGPKASFDWRVEAHDRVAEAGIERMGLGVLLGLADPREDLRKMLRHASYLQERFPDRTLAFSLPRIHEAPTSFTIPFRVTDDELIRMYCALRIAFPKAELVLSTREAEGLRGLLAELCITQMSAGSCTVPGGYDTEPDPNAGQFPVADHRSPDRVAQWLREHGFLVCWSARETRTSQSPAIPGEKVCHRSGQTVR